MKKYVLDTNVFIDAVNPTQKAYTSIRKLFVAAEAKKISLGVSLHTISELKAKPDAALELAESMPRIDHYPFGRWKDIVVPWGQICGTWGDMTANDKRQAELEKLAKSGNDIRDRGAFIDALKSNYDGFVTSDKQFVGSGPAKRISDHYFTKVYSPEDLCKELGL